VSIKAESVEHELTVKELLELLLLEFKIIKTHLEIVTDQKIKPEDIDEN
jgi:hypothetical protein